MRRGVVKTTDVADHDTMGHGRPSMVTEPCADPNPDPVIVMDWPPYGVPLAGAIWEMLTAIDCHLGRLRKALLEVWETIAEKVGCTEARRDVDL